MGALESYHRRQQSLRALKSSPRRPIPSVLPAVFNIIDLGVTTDCSFVSSE